MKNKRKTRATPILKRFKLEQKYYSNLCSRKQISNIDNISKYTVNQCLTLYDKRNIPVTDIEFSNIHKKKFNFDLYKDEVVGYIKSYLKEAKTKKLPMLSAKKITLHLLEKHPEIDYSFQKVRNYIMPLKRQFLDKQRKYIPLTHYPYEAQVDFGKTYIIYDGKLVWNYFLVMSFPHSNTFYCQIMKTRNNHELIAAMDKIFSYIGGIPHEIWFDNDALFCIIKDKTRCLNILFSKYVKQHKFKPVFVNAASGNEKGNVENYVRIARNNLLTPIPEITNLQAYNSELLKRCDKMNSRFNIDGEKRINVLKKDKECFLPFKLTAYLIENFICQTDIIGRIKVLQKYYYLPLKYANPVGKRKDRFTFKVVVSRHNIRVFDIKSKEPIEIFARLSEDETYPINNWGEYIKIFSSHPHLIYTTGFFETLPELLQKNYIFLNILQQKAVLKNMYNIYEKTDLETAYKVAIICLKGKRLSQHDFIMALHNLNIDPMFMYPCLED